MGRNTLVVYDAPAAATGNEDFRVMARTPGEQWRELFVYEVKVDMHQVRRASMVYFDMEGEVEICVEPQKAQAVKVEIRPLSKAVPYSLENNRITFKLDRPAKLSVEVNGERFSNLHLFANPLESNRPDPEGDGVLLLKPAVHRTIDIVRQAVEMKEAGGGRPVLYFAPGMHYLEETLLHIPSGTSVYLAGGAVLVGSLVCDRVEDVTIYGRGVVYLSDFHRFSSFRGVRIVFSKRVSIEGIVTVDPPHYSIYIGKSEQIAIENFKTFSTRGWSDGIDIMASSDIVIRDVFLRTSDDSIAIYGSRWDFYGDSRNIEVKDAILWADVAHPLMIGTHGDHHRDGDLIENIRYENIDILEHHEPQENYWGAMTINAGDKNTVRNVSYDNIRVEDFELGQLVDIRVIWNKDYNPVPGNRIEGIRFSNIVYNGANRNPSRIYGFSQDRPVKDVVFENVVINGVPVTDAESGKFSVNEFAHDISFVVDGEKRLEDE